MSQLPIDPEVFKKCVKQFVEELSYRISWEMVFAEFQVNSQEEVYALLLKPETMREQCARLCKVCHNTIEKFREHYRFLYHYPNRETTVSQHLTNK